MSIADLLRHRRHTPGNRRHFPRPPMPTRRAPDPKKDVAITLEITLASGGEPLAGVECSIVNNNTGVPSARYTDGNGYTNHGVLGKAGDLITITTNGYDIVESSHMPDVGPAYYYLTDAPVQQIELGLESFRRGPRPVEPLVRGPLPPFVEPVNYAIALPWDPPESRDYYRGDAWGVVMEGAPVIDRGVSSRHPERILSWFIDRYPMDFQEAYLEKYAGYQYTHLALSYADSTAAKDQPMDKPPGAGRTLDEFLETCALVKRYVPYVHVLVGSKYFQPANMSAQQWADFADPIIDALIAAGVVDELTLGWEWNLWNTPGTPTIDAFKHAGQKLHAAGRSFWMHFSPHVTSWFADGEPRGRFGFYDDIAPDVDGLMYQSMGAYWSAQMLQARIVDSLWQFGERGNDVKFRMWEDFATFMWDNDEVTVEQDEIPGNLVTVSCLPDDANLRCYVACCTSDNVKWTDAKVWGFGNGGRRPDGSRL